MREEMRREENNRNSSGDKMNMKKTKRRYTSKEDSTPQGRTLFSELAHNPIQPQPKSSRTPKQGLTLDRKKRRGDVRVKILSKNLTPRAEKCPRTNTGDTKSYRRSVPAGAQQQRLSKISPPGLRLELQDPWMIDPPASDGPKPEERTTWSPP